MASILYLASFALGSFCPMSMVSAMESPHAKNHDSQMEVALMSPYMPMTPAAPMSVAPVVYQVSTSMAQPSTTCPGGNCFMADHSQKQEISVFVASIQIQGAALPATFPSSIDSLPASILPSPIHTGGTHLANTISTIVLRV